MKEIFAIEYFAPETRAVCHQRSSHLLGTAFTIDTHAMDYSLSTPFFPRR
jgi:hypothetical protein